MWIIYAFQDAVALHVISAFRSCLQSLRVLTNQCIDGKVRLISVSTLFMVLLSLGPKTALAVLLMLVFALP